MSLPPYGAIRCDLCAGQGGHHVAEPCPCIGWNWGGGCVHGPSGQVWQTCSRCFGHGTLRCHVCKREAVTLDAENRPLCPACLEKAGVPEATVSAASGTQAGEVRRAVQRRVLTPSMDSNRGADAPAKTRPILA